jgi:hypothetical protein
VVQRRRLNVFSLSFLDVMSCGFGAVVLIFLIINHDSQEDQEVVNDDLLAEIRLLDYQVQQGEKDLFELIETMDDINARVERSDENLATTQDTIETQEARLEELKESSVAQTESLKALTADIESREDEVERLMALKAANDGAQVRAFEGEGDRQYLTGLKVGGRNIVIAVDTSASMLDDTIVNVLRRRNMSEESQRAAPKWQRAVRTVEWLAAQLPLDAEFQLYAFAENTQSLVADSEMDWVPMHDGRALNAAVEELRGMAPKGGSSLANLILAVRELAPIPDNVYLITDGLPTQGENPPRGAMVTGKRRLELFGDAVNRLPKQIPVNVIMFPMEGDPMASAAYWNVARVTGGAFISPSWDWP